MDKKRTIVFNDRTQGLEGDFPVALVYGQEIHSVDGTKFNDLVVDPVFNQAIYNNLFGRMMTLIEATTTDSLRIKAVKDVFSKELRSWQNSVYSSARELAEGGDSSVNLYTRSYKQIE